MPSEELVTAQRRTRNTVQAVFEKLQTVRIQLDVVAQNVCDMKEYYATVDDRLKVLLAESSYIEDTCCITTRTKAWRATFHIARQFSCNQSILGSLITKEYSRQQLLSKNFQHSQPPPDVTALCLQSSDRELSISEIKYARTSGSRGIYMRRTLPFRCGS